MCKVGANMATATGHKFTLGCRLFFSLVLTNEGCPIAYSNCESEVTGSRDENRD